MAEGGVQPTPRLLAFLICERAEQRGQRYTLHNVQDQFVMRAERTLKPTVFIKFTDAVGVYTIVVEAMIGGRFQEVIRGRAEAPKPTATVSAAFQFEFGGGRADVMELRLMANDIVIGRASFDVELRH